MTANTAIKAIVMEFEVTQAPAKVWRALTEPALLEKWLMSSDMKAAVGERFQFRDKPQPWWDGIVNCEVLEADAPKRLKYTWTSGPKESPMNTVVTWTLTPTASGGTKLSMIHDGFGPPEEPFYQGASQGWKRMIGEKLVEVLAGME